MYSPTFNKIYVGFTSDIQIRFKSHNKLETKGYTVKFRPWITLFTEEFPSKKEVMTREKELKSSMTQLWPFFMPFILKL